MNEWNKTNGIVDLSQFVIADMDTTGTVWDIVLTRDSTKAFVIDFCIIYP